jgi:hypothetical protein
MKRLLTLLILLTLPFAACSDDEDSTTPVLRYSLTITNKTINDYELYQKPTEQGDDFERTGYVLSNVNYRITNLATDKTHTFRLVPDGNDVEDFTYEKVVTSDGIDQTWVVY